MEFKYLLINFMLMNETDVLLGGEYNDTKKIKKGS